MSVLGDLFSGRGGIDKWMHDTFGGDAVIVHAGKRVYNERLDTWDVIEEDSYFHTTFLPLPRTQMDEVVRRGGLEENIELGGSVPTCDLTKQLVPNHDKIIYRGETFTIIRVEDNGVDNRAGHVLVFGAR